MNKSRYKKVETSWLTRLQLIGRILLGITILSVIFNFTYHIPSFTETRTLYPTAEQLLQSYKARIIYYQNTPISEVLEEEATFLDILATNPELFYRSALTTSTNGDTFQFVQLRDLSKYKSYRPLQFTETPTDPRTFACSEPYSNDVYPCYLVFQKTTAPEVTHIARLPFGGSPEKIEWLDQDHLAIGIHKEGLANRATGTAYEFCSKHNDSSNGFVVFNVSTETFSDELDITCASQLLEPYYSFVFDAAYLTQMELRLDRYQHTTNNESIDIEIRLYKSASQQLIATLKNIPLEPCDGIGCGLSLDFKALTDKTLNTWNQEKQTYGEFHFQIRDTHYIVNTETGKLSKEKVPTLDKN